jgi:hypothetical protein
MTNFDTCEKYRRDRTGQLRGRIQELQNSEAWRLTLPAEAIRRFPAANSAGTGGTPMILFARPERHARRPLLKKPRGEPSQVFDLDLGAIDEIFGSVLDKNNPTKGGNREKC